MSNSIVNPSELDYDKLTFGEKNTHASGASFVSMKYNNQQFLLQLPKLTGFGVDVFEDDKTGVKKYTMSVQFKKEKIDEDNKVKNALEGLQNFEKEVKKWAQKNSHELLKKKNASADFIDATFNEILKESKDKDSGEADGRYYTLKLKLKLNKKDEQKFDLGAFTSKKEKMDLNKDNISDLVKKWGEVKTVISPNIWIISGKIGISWNLWQLKYWEPEGGQVLNKEELCMIDSSSDEESDEENEDNKNDVVMSDSD